MPYIQNLHSFTFLQLSFAFSISSVFPEAPTLVRKDPKEQKKKKNPLEFTIFKQHIHKHKYTHTDAHSCLKPSLTRLLIQVHKVSCQNVCDMWKFVVSYLLVATRIKWKVFWTWTNDSCVFRFLSNTRLPSGGWWRNYITLGWMDGWTYLRRVHAWVAMSCSCRRLCLSSSTLKWMQPLSASSVSSSIRFSFICSVYRMRKTETDAEVWYRRQKCDSLKWKQSVNTQTVSESV